MPSDSPYSNLKMAPDSPTRTRAEQIADTIARDIVEGHLQPEQKLSEVELAKFFQVSRGPIRDALALLERNMLVTIKPRSYTLVNKLTYRELQQMFEFRKAVLSLACQFAATNRLDGDIQRLRDAHTQLKLAGSTDTVDYSALMFPATQLWDVVIDASHSQVVRQACLHLTGGNIWSRAVAGKIANSKLPKHGRKRLSLWEDVINAIENKDSDVACTTGMCLVENNWDLLKDSFRQYFPEH